MKLGEALAERAALSRQIANLRQRINAVISFHEDEEPAENATTLLTQADTTAEQLAILILRINMTNTATAFGENMNVTGALARRDMLNTKLATLEGVARSVGNRGGYWGGRTAKTELKTVFAVNATEIQEQIEALQVERRQLDARLQALSWETDLYEG